MKITYISASIIPSTKANSVHVMKMCNGLAQNGHIVTLVGTKGNEKTDNIYKYYNVEKSFQLRLSKNNKMSSINRLIAGIRYSIGADIVYTRWIVAAMLLILFTKKKVIFEYHSPFKKGLYKYFESHIIKSKKVIRHIFITNTLKQYYVERYSLGKKEDLLVLSDAADIIQLKSNGKVEKQYDCIYVGSFQKGKGVDLIIELANMMPHVSFAVVGGDETEVRRKKEFNACKNIKWFGYLPHEKIHTVLNNSKIALLPNQPKVFVGSANQDIGEWTSPMKLFEYMASGKAIVASNLPVLKEILVDEKNCLLADHDDANEWMNAINRLLMDKQLLKKISSHAYEESKYKYTWKNRAKQAVKNLSIKETKKY